MSKKNEFKVDSVDLKGSNLIEASAGTGKTYSIAILVLRFLLEKGFLLQEILMVTFTNAAVAELEVRIRKFIRDAIFYVSKDDNNIDSTIKLIVDNAIKSKGKAYVIDILQKANASLDDKSIFTIHSFCQSVLTEFAFETKQLFSSDIIADSSEIIKYAVMEYWRKELTTLKTEYLQQLIHYGFDFKEIVTVVSKALAGNRFVCDPDLNLDDVFAKLEDKIKFCDDFKEENYYHLLDENLSDIVAMIKTFPNASRTFKPTKQTKEVFFEKLIEKYNLDDESKGAYNCAVEIMETYFRDLITFIENKQEIEHAFNEMKYSMYGDAIAYTSDYISNKKQALNLMSYDDLIINLSTAIKNDSLDILKDKLSNKYKAVFIDEFQDTDKQQYDIFNNAFNGKSILFYIGDPKQSIYSFRGADIESYKHAASLVDYQYTMSSNYRSSSSLISALNHFFASSSDVFLDNKILYEQVKCGAPKAELTLDDVQVKNLSISSYKNKTMISDAVVCEIFSLLNENYAIGDKRIMPSDIAVMVRNKSEGIAIKNMLSKLKIPSVSIDDTKIFSTEEAKFIYDVLSAASEQNKSNISRALLYKYTSYDKEAILRLDDEIVLENFRNIKEKWSDAGVYQALSLFKSLYVNNKTLLSHSYGERALSNILQLFEILHKIENLRSFAPNESLAYFKKLIEGLEDSSDEYAQRLESDKDAVQIVTIHKSKGLQYNIVFAPFLDLKPFDGSPIQYRTDEGEYCFSFNDEGKKSYELQANQENRRLIYVSLTRAVYKLFVYSNTGKKGAIAQLLPILPGNEFCEEIMSSEASDPAELKPIGSAGKEKEALNRVFEGQVDKGWSVYSFSALSSLHKTYRPTSLVENIDYEHFVFDKLARGGLLGNFLHDLLEKAKFSNNKFQKLITSVAKSYPSVYDEDDIDSYNQLMNEVLKTNLLGNESFSLKSIDNNKRISELEFYFSLNNCDARQLNDLYDSINVNRSVVLDGYMTGFVDLFFEHNGKYYILDWKSNYLGNTLEDYSQDKLENAMIDNNYHLQYLIYTIAVCRFLKLNKPDFDYSRDFGGVYYLFLRACRDGKSTGVFYNKPDIKLIEEMDLLMS